MRPSVPSLRTKGQAEKTGSHLQQLVSDPHPSVCSSRPLWFDAHHEYAHPWPVLIASKTEPQAILILFQLDNVQFSRQICIPLPDLFYIRNGKKNRAWVFITEMSAFSHFSVVHLQGCLRINHLRLSWPWGQAIVSSYFYLHISLDCPPNFSLLVPISLTFHELFLSFRKLPKYG